MVVCGGAAVTGAYVADIDYRLRTSDFITYNTTRLQVDRTPPYRSSCMGAALAAGAFSAGAAGAPQGWHVACVCVFGGYMLWKSLKNGSQALVRR